jgi:hypothetical protein
MLHLPASFAYSTSVFGEPCTRLLRGTELEVVDWPVGSWYTPPGNYHWLITRLDEEVEIRILWFPRPPNHRPDEQGDVVFATRCPLRRFAVQVKNQLQQLASTQPGEDYANSLVLKLTEALRALR